MSNGSHLHLSGDEDEDAREEGKIGSDEYTSPWRVSGGGGNFSRGSSVGWETSSQAARSILGGIFNNLPVTEETGEGSQELEVSQHNEPEADNLEEEDMDDEEEDPRLEVAMRMEELDKVHKSFSELENSLA